MRISRLKWPICMCIFIISIVGTFSWRPVDATRLGQTVPTATPTVDPAITPTATATLLPTASPTAAASAVPETSSQPAAPAPEAPKLLPVAGAASLFVPGALIAGAGVTLMFATLQRRRKHPHRNSD